MREITEIVAIILLFGAVPSVIAFNFNYINLNENTIEEVSEITGMKKENLKMKLHRACKKMYVVLNERLKSETKNIL